MLKIKTKRILAMAVASLLVTTMMGCRHDWEVVESGMDSAFPATNSTRYLQVEDEETWNFLYRWTTGNNQNWEELPEAIRDIEFTTKINNFTFQQNVIAAALFPSYNEENQVDLVEIVDVTDEGPGQDPVVHIAVRQTGGAPGNEMTPYFFTRIANQSRQVHFATNALGGAPINLVPAEPISYDDLVTEEFQSRINWYHAHRYYPTPEMNANNLPDENGLCPYRHVGNRTLRMTEFEEGDLTIADNHTSGDYFRVSRQVLYCEGHGEYWVKNTFMDENGYPEEGLADLMTYLNSLFPGLDWNTPFYYRFSPGQYP